MWIENDELDLLDSIFESEDMIPRNRKGGLKLRQISFFMSNTKAITNVCKNLERYAMQSIMPHQYVEVLRKMGLVNKKEEITKYGEMLLKIIYHDNNRIIDEFNQPNVNIEKISEDIPFIIEFFLFAVVKKCLDSPSECEKSEIEYSDLASEPLDSLKYFFSNIIDTLLEPTNKTVNLNTLFDFDNDDFYYTIQGMNFSGYEVKRLFRLEQVKMEQAWKLYNRVLGSVRGVDVSTLTPREKKYYEYATYYNDLVQKDVRNRVKHSILNFILLDSIIAQRNKTKIIRKPEYNAILPYDFIEEVFDRYKLRDVYNLVYFEKDSKYITKEIKPFKITNDLILDIDTDSKFMIEEVELRKQRINIGDSVIFADERLEHLLKYNVYDIRILKMMDTSIEVILEKKEEINRDMEESILIKFREE